MNNMVEQIAIPAACNLFEWKNCFAATIFWNKILRGLFYALGSGFRKVRSERIKGSGIEKRTEKRGWSDEADKTCGW
jgi:hypothetical protein